MELPGSCSFKGGVCSEVDGVDALRVRLMLALFTFCIFWRICPKGGECCSKWGACAYRDWIDR